MGSPAPRARTHRLVAQWESTVLTRRGSAVQVRPGLPLPSHRLPGGFFYPSPAPGWGCRVGPPADQAERFVRASDVSDALSFSTGVTRPSVSVKSVWVDALRRSLGPTADVYWLRCRWPASVSLTNTLACANPAGFPRAGRPTGPFDPVWLPSRPLFRLIYLWWARRRSVFRSLPVFPTLVLESI